MSFDGRAARAGGVSLQVLTLLTLPLAAACARSGGSRASTDPTAIVDTKISSAAVTAAPPPPPLAPADAKTREQCATICQKSLDLKCKQPDQCLPTCLAMASATPCSAQVSAFYACLVGEPSAHWQCDDDNGVAQIRDGFCEQQQAQAFGCMEAKMKP